jgi:hypothetical protein
MIGDAPSQVNADALLCSVATYKVNVAEVAERVRMAQAVSHPLVLIP